MSGKMRFLQIYNELEHTVNSRASWETKYDLCFGYRNGIYDRMVRTGVALLDYVDPDTSQKEDVLTLYAAAKRTAEQVEIEIGHKGGQNDKNT